MAMRPRFLRLYDQIVVLHQRRVGKAADGLEGFAAQEDRLIAEGELEESAALRDHPLHPAQPPTRLIELEAEGPGGDARLTQERGLDVTGEIEPAERYRRGGTPGCRRRPPPRPDSAASPRPGGAANDSRAGRLGFLNCRVGAAAVRDDHFRDARAPHSAHATPDAALLVECWNDYGDA